MQSSCSTKAVAVILILFVLIGLLYVTQLRGFRVQSWWDPDQQWTSAVPLLWSPASGSLASGSLASGSPALGLQIQSSDPDSRIRDLDSDLHMPQRMQYPQPSITRGRTDVVTVTPWLAPVVWESTFDPVLLDAIFKPKNLSIAATVFAVGKYVMFLNDFLVTAEQFFFVGFNVHIHVFTDRPQEVPQVKMAVGRKVLVHVVPGSQRWQEISARRMEMINALLRQIQNSTHFVFCLDVDSKFHGRWSTESLGQSVAVVHPGYYGNGRSQFPYERRPVSRAYMAPSDGDFYYCGGAFGGAVDRVLEMTRVCSENYRDDEKRGVEAAWQEESHLNRYFWDHKPTKVLSPEYLWQDFKQRNPEVRVVRFSGVIKNYAAIRPNN